MPRSRSSRRRTPRKKARRRRYAAAGIPLPPGRNAARAFDAVEAFEAARKKGRRDPSCTGCTVDAAIEVVHEFLDRELSRGSFPDYFEASLRYANLLSRLGADEANVIAFILPRLPFDLTADGRTPAEHFILRWGTALPRGAVEAVKALLSAEDEFVEVTEEEGRPALRRLRGTARRSWGHAVPIPDGAIALGRLVQMRGRFHLFTPEPFPDVTRATWRGAVPMVGLFRTTIREELQIGFRSPEKDLHLISLAQRVFLEDLEKSQRRRRERRKERPGRSKGG
jgi:hypothetical protein